MKLPRDLPWHAAMAGAVGMSIGMMWYGLSTGETWLVVLTSFCGGITISNGIEYVLREVKWRQMSRDEEVLLKALSPDACREPWKRSKK